MTVKNHLAGQPGVWGRATLIVLAACCLSLALAVPARAGSSLVPDDPNWTAVYMFGEGANNGDAAAGGFGITAFTDPCIVLSAAMFSSYSRYAAWSGIEGSLGIAAPTFLTPYATVGVVMATADDTTDMNGNVIAAFETFAEWGGMLRAYPVWISAGRRDYLGNNGISRGDVTDLVMFGWSVQFD